jgi:hypothetical protein
MNRNRAPEDNRWLWLTDDAEAVALEETHFTKANEAGMTAGLRQAVLGELYGFNVAASYNTPFVENLTLPAVEVDDLASDAAAGATTVVTDAGATYAVGEYITFPGTDNVPYKVIGIATDTLTLNRPIRYALTAATQDVQRINTGTVDLAGHTGVSAYPAAYDKEIQVDGTGVPQVGQLVSFATAGTPNVNLAGEYTILDTRSIWIIRLRLRSSMVTSLVTVQTVATTSSWFRMPSRLSCDQWNRLFRVPVVSVAWPSTTTWRCVRRSVTTSTRKSTLSPSTCCLA